MSHRLATLTVPAGLELQRSTQEFTAGSVPAGLLRAHRVADGVWGVLRVTAGEVVFVVEMSSASVDDASRRLRAGDHQVIEPGVLHHVEPDPEARFLVEFHGRGAPGR